MPINTIMYVVIEVAYRLVLALVLHVLRLSGY